VKLAGAWQPGTGWV